MEDLLFEDIYLKSLTFDELVDFIIENGNQELPNGFLIMVKQSNLGGWKFPVIILIDYKTVNHDVFIRGSNKIFKLNFNNSSLDYLCDLDSPFLNTVFKGDDRIEKFNPPKIEKVVNILFKEDSKSYVILAVKIYC